LGFNVSSRRISGLSPQVECKFKANPGALSSGLYACQLVCRVCYLLETLLVWLTLVTILRSGQILTTTDAPSTFSFSEHQGGVERAESYSSLGSRGVAYILKGSN